VVAAVVVEMVVSAVQSLEVDHRRMRNIIDEFSWWRCGSWIHRP
jgi:hypothetical protein